MKVQYYYPNQAKNNGWVSLYDIGNMNIDELNLEKKKGRWKGENLPQH